MSGVSQQNTRKHAELLGVDPLKDIMVWQLNAALKLTTQTYFNVKGGPWPIKLR